ncbi:MAG: hypothetical protein ABEJ65_03415 [bacterium]
MKTFTIGKGENQLEFQGKKLNENILGTGPDDTKQITYYKTLDDRYLKHTIHNVNKDEDEQNHEIEEVSSFEVP